MSAEVIDFEQVNQEPIKFDPEKNYTWKVDDQFILTGDEFGTIINALRAVLGTQEAKALFMAQTAHDKFQNAFARAVEAGVAKEVEPSPKNSL